MSGGTERRRERCHALLLVPTALTLVVTCATTASSMLAMAPREGRLALIALLEGGSAEVGPAGLPARSGVPEGADR